MTSLPAAAAISVRCVTQFGEDVVVVFALMSSFFEHSNVKSI